MITTPMAATRLAAASNVPERDVGWAGMKDRREVTRQWLSLPHGAGPAGQLGFDKVFELAADHVEERRGD